MKYTMKKLKVSIVGLLLAVCVVVPAIADDIEIYTALSSGQVTIQPNILFILDSSGSMNTTVITVSVPYDSSVTYSGDCTAGRIYFESGGDIPNCGGWRASNSYIYESANKCDHSINEYDDTDALTGNPGSLYTTGYFKGQLAQYSEDSTCSWSWWTGWTCSSPGWGSLSTDHTAPVECYKDRGIHGETTASGDKYITDSGSGWTSTVTPDPHPVWGGGDNNYTLYHSNYINYLNDPSTTEESTRFIEMQRSIINLVEANTSINVGLMRYDRSSSYEGGPVIYAMEDVNTARQAFKDAVNDMNAGGYTPLAETYYEALLYYGGAEIYYGASTSPSIDPGAKEVGNESHYQTPITDVCQKNYIVYLTDGEPTRDQLTSGELATLPGMSTSCASISTPDTLDNCLLPLADWAKNKDVAHRAIPAHDGSQNITTYTIGFDLDSGASAEADAVELLKRTAKAGGGSFYSAKDSNSLTGVFNQIIAEVLAVNGTFSSPAVSVNAFNRATNLEDLYFTLFKPTDYEHWEGNLKKFKLEFDAGDLPFVADMNHHPAVDVDTGFFEDSSQSYWSAAADGAETAEGGAASNIALPRNAYTFTGTYSGTTGVLTPSDVALISGANSLDHNNTTNITDVMLGGVAANADVVVTSTITYTYTEALLRWAAGEDLMDVNSDGDVTDIRQEMGDPLHAEPALVQYGLTDPSDPDSDPDLVAYVATNDGYLHAFDSITGEENFAFVPQEMLHRLQNIFEDTGVTGKAYGLDGNVVPWINDANHDGKIVAGDGDHVYLYFGMRRGGRYIYSMDVTDRNSPELRWVIEGGTGDYAELGQTWSAPNVEKIKIGGSEKTVLIFGAGYDVNQDALTTRGVDGIGRGIFIVDADSGEVLWRAGPDGGADLQLTDMQYSIPARIKPIDIDSDGFTDRLYAGDMGGQLWRIDIDNDATGSISVTGGRIADLAADGSVNDNRRFYSSPDVALIIEQGHSPYLSVIANSGYRAHPLQTDTHDRLYMIRDNDVYQVPTSYTTVTEADLYDTTNNDIGQGDQTTIDAAKFTLNAANGWFITLNEMDGSFVGEKSLSEPLILNGVAIFTTFIPAEAGLGEDLCKGNDGTGAIYFVNVVDGTPTYDNTSDDAKSREDRRTFLARGGIPPTPRVIITKDGIPTLCVGTECSKSGDVGSLQKMYWYEVEE